MAEIEREAGEMMMLCSTSVFDKPLQMLRVVLKGSNHFQAQSKIEGAHSVWTVAKGCKTLPS